MDHLKDDGKELMIHKGSTPGSSVPASLPAHIFKKMEPYVPGSVRDGSIVVRGGKSYMVVDGGALVRMDKNRAKDKNRKKNKDRA